MGNLITANKLPEFMTKTNMYLQESLKASKSITSILSRKLILIFFSTEKCSGGILWQCPFNGPVDWVAPSVGVAGDGGFSRIWLV